MWDPKQDKKLQEAVCSYLSEHNMTLSSNATYIAGIDCVQIRIGGVPVLEVNLPPMSDYVVEKTEHTDKYLRKKNPIAV